MPSGLSCLQWACRFVGVPAPARAPSKRTRNRAQHHCGAERHRSRGRRWPASPPPLRTRASPLSPRPLSPRSDRDCAQVPGRAYPCGADHPSQRVPCTMGAPPVVDGCATTRVASRALKDSIADLIAAGKIELQCQHMPTQAMARPCPNQPRPFPDLFQTFPALGARKEPLRRRELAGSLREEAGSLREEAGSSREEG